MQNPRNTGGFFCHHIAFKFVLSQVLFVAIAAYLILLPTVGIKPDLLWHDDQRLAQIALLVMIAANAALGFTPARRFMVVPGWAFISTRTQFVLLAAFVLGAVSSALAPVPRWAAIEWSMMVLLMALGVSVAALRRKLGDKFDRLLLGVLLFTATAFVLKVFAAYTAAIVERLPIHIWWLLDGFSNPRFFGHFQTMTLPLLVLPAMFWAKTPLSRISLALLPALWWMLSIASGTRGTWLAMMAACAVVLVCVRHKGYHWLKWQLGTFLAGLAAYGLFFFVVPGLFSVQTDTVNRLPDIANLAFRDVLWKSAFEHVVAHPILGIGPMHFAYYPNAVAAHPHMSLLQWAAEWGLPSALLVLGVVLHAGMSYVRQLRATAPEDGTGAYTLRLGLLASLCAAAAQSLVDGVIVMPYSQTLLAVICGWALAIHQCSSPSPNRIDWAAERIGMAIILLSIALLLGGVFPEIRAIASKEGAFNASVIQEQVLLRPRFWSQGWIYD